MGGDGSVKTKKAGAPLFLEIYNPGYSKFLQFDQTRPISRESTDIASLSPSLSSDPDNTFRRRLYMDGSRFGDHSYGHRKTPSWNGEQQTQRSSVQLNRQSLQAAPKALADRRSKGYTFRSPWGGKCEFSTGTAGRSLKVRKRLSSLIQHDVLMFCSVSTFLRTHQARRLKLVSCASTFQQAAVPRVLRPLNLEQKDHQ